MVHIKNYSDYKYSFVWMDALYLTYLLNSIAGQVVFKNFSYSKQHQDEHPCIPILVHLSVYLFRIES